MQSPRQPSLSTPLNPPSHYQPLVNGLPRWLADATPARREALKNNRRPLTAQIKTAPQARHAELRTTIAEHMKAQNSVDQTLAQLQDVNAYAEPLLKAALKSTFGMDLDVKETFLRLYIPVKSGLSTLPASRPWTVSLLDAALHNFEEDETRADAYGDGSGFITRPSAQGRFETLPQVGAKISITDFIRLCRELDIGAGYKTHLESKLGIIDPAVAATLQPRLKDSQKAAFKAALQLARMSGDIAEDWFLMIDAMLDGVQGMRVEQQMLQFQDLTMMSAELTGIVIVAPDLAQARAPKGMVVYVPDDPEHPVKQYASSAAMEMELSRQLRSTDYQRFFSRFVLHEQRGHFFSQLNNRLSQAQWHKPQPGSQEPAWRETPIERPHLQLAASPFSGDLWQHLYQGKLNKILNDAATIAVSTAMADRNARWALWDSFVNIASTILEIASFVVLPFVPFLGELMMAYMAYQFLDEVFEGIIEWAEGQTTEAGEHLFNALESLVQLGTFGIGGGIAMAEIPRLLPAPVVAFIDRFKPVKLRNGKTLYWKPDLKPYQRRVSPPAESAPDSQGLHLHQGKRVMKIDQAHYEVSDHEQPGKLYIEHPTRPDAYRPTVRHNGDGAFHTELEHPLEWDTATVLQRLSPGMESFSPEQRARILKVSGYDEDALRAMHVNQERMPPLLADTVQRFRLDQQLQDFITRMASDKPEDYLGADPLIQLQLLNDQGLWPATRRLRLIDRQDRVVWESSTNAALPPTEIRQNRLTDNDLLTTVLQQLSETEIRRLPGYEFAQRFPLHVRARMLRSRLAQRAIEQRNSLFEQRYQALQQREAPLLRKVAVHAPDLPARLTEELAGTATGAQLLDINAGRWPERQQALSQEAAHALRINRAYEGLELASVHNPDTDTLALHSLRRLPGWSSDVYLEVRSQSFTGAALDSTGRLDAPVRKVLVRLTDGRWKPYDESGLELNASTDFYTCVLQALPDAQRRSLNLHIGEGPKLKQAIRDNPLPRAELRLPAQSEPPLVAGIDTLRLRGTGGHRQLVQTTETVYGRIRSLYPGVSDVELLTMARQLESRPDGAHAELTRLEMQYSQLNLDLADWVANPPRNHPADGSRLTGERREAVMRDRQMFALELRKCWRRETNGQLGHRLAFAEPIMGDLPTLTTDFGHVSSLELTGTGTPGALNAFLERLPALRVADLRNFDLHNLPPRLSQLALLKQLTLRHCHISLTPENQRILSLLNELLSLDLRGNPLGQAPDFNFMPHLHHLDLSQTGLSELPRGVLNLAQLRSLWLTDNQITTLPNELFAMTARSTSGFDFNGNPLHDATREQVKLYFSRTGNNLGIRPVQTDIDRIKVLFTDLDDQRASELIYSLHGTLVQGRLQLDRWESEITGLTASLAQWAKDTPQQHPATGQTLTLAEHSSQFYARETFARSIERQWRRRWATDGVSRTDVFSANVEFIGDMPALDADFSHITDLSLNGNKHINATFPFLGSFNRLKRLNLHNFSLDQLTLTLTSMPLLDTLILHDCGVSWTPELQTTLATLRRLESLELPGNTLGSPPDASALVRLNYLDLSRTAITEAPAGISGHPKLRTVIASNNLISALPDEFFGMPAAGKREWDFSGNPLTREMLEKIKAYARENSVDFGVFATQTDTEATLALFPDLDHEEASDVFYSLPGDLDSSRSLLRHWRTEFEQLVSDLARWKEAIRAPGNPDSRAMNTPQLLAEYSARTTFAEQLKQLWRTRSSTHPRQRMNVLSTHLSFTGTMPELSTDFSHIQTLSLTGSPALNGIETFLGNFSGLLRLELHDFDLKESFLPSLQGTRLERLKLKNCALTLTAQSRAALSGFTQLQHLDLSHNPLELPPSLESLPALAELRISDTWISTVPDGLPGHPRLEVAYLERNRIQELPATLFQASARPPSILSFANNPLSTATRERIKLRYRLFNQDFGVSIPRGDLERMLELFPSLDLNQANHALYLLPGSLEDGRLQISRWEAELQQLDSDLEQWRADVPTHYPGSSTALSEVDQATERAKRIMFRLGIETFWRERSQEMPESRATSLHLDASFIGDLPTLSADFSHVRTLSITGNPRLTAGTGFLNNFTSLETLELRDLNLRAVPEALNQMPDLQLLVMNNCAIVLDEEGADTLSSLTRLVSLDLYNNPLGRSPDLRSMPALKFLDLANTGIDELPSGLTTLPHLNTAILSGNLIRELPAALFDLPTDVSKGYDLNNNPLSAAARESIKTYYRVNGVDFAVLAEPADIARIQTLYPTLDDGEASKLLYRFEGTLADGRTELARHEAELDRLRQDLAAWENDLPEALTVRARELEQSNRQEFRDSLLRCWRLRAIDGYHEFTSLIPIRGRLPTLSVEFAHVYSLDLHGQNGFPIHPGRFLDAFANLQLLEIRNYDMLNIPEAIFRMKRLKGLILPSCRITLSPEDVARLATLDRLDLLHLQDNPLGLTPDLRNLQELIDLDLSNTGIREIPKGVLENSHWEEVDLSNNQINEMPEELMEVPAVIGDRYDLSGNLFSPRAMARIREYYDVTGQDLNVEGLIDQPPARLGIAIEP